MQTLLELVAAINKNKTKSVSVIEHGHSDGTKLYQLYEQISSGKVTCDEEAFALLYPGTSNKNPYYKLKHELRERLYNTAFFVDAKKSKGNQRREAMLNCQYYHAVSWVLAILGARKNAEALIRKIIKLAKKYEFTYEYLNALQRLSNFLVLRGNVKELGTVNEEIIAWSEAFRRQIFCDIYARNIQIQYTKDRSTKSYVVEQIERYIDHLDSLPPAPETLKSFYFYNMLKMYLEMALNRYDAAIAVGLPILERVRNYRFLDRVALYGVSVNLTACFIATKRYEEGAAVLEDLLVQLKALKSSFNWFKAKEMSFMLSIHSRRYDVSRTVLREVSESPRFAKMPEYIQETWRIFGAYEEVLVQSGRLPAQKVAGKRVFRLRRYLNNVPTFSKDKRGLNVPILVSQIVLLLQTKGYDELIDRFEALAKYRDRYLNPDVNYRSNIFLRMVLEIVKRNFDRALIKRKAAKLSDLLSGAPTDVMNQSYDQEIIPYEDLWEIILEALE